jgi:hypothetical protein
MLGVASKKPFKSQRINEPQITTPVRAFFTCSLLFIYACVRTEKLAGTWKLTAATPVLPATRTVSLEESML